MHLMRLHIVHGAKNLNYHTFFGKKYPTTLHIHVLHLPTPPCRGFLNLGKQPTVGDPPQSHFL